MQKFVSRLLAASLLVLSGCATVPTAPPEEDAAAKTFEVPEGKSNIYVARPSEFGGAILFSVTLDGELQGQLAANTYYFFQEEPGRHVLIILGGEGQDMMEFETEAGQNYFFRADPTMGFLAARVNIVQVSDEEEGRRMVNGCKLAEIGAFDGQD